MTLRPTLAYRWGGGHRSALGNVTLGLSPHTLADYCKIGRSTLVRGVDFVVRHPRQWRKKLYFTERGLARLLAQDYTVSWRGKSMTSVKHSRELAARPLETYGRHERKMRLLHTLYLMAQTYLDRPCAVPGCPCVTHSSYKVPQADYVRAMLEPRPSAYPKGGRYTKAGKFIPHM